jgi:GGDEF domain-containing protein
MNEWLRGPKLWCMAPIAFATDAAVALDDPVTGFGNRHKLMADLGKALEPGCPPSVLAVFDLVGMEEYRRLYGEKAGEELIACLAGRFACVVNLARAARPFGGLEESVALCYRARRDEFCVLVNMPFDKVRYLLDDVAAALTDDDLPSLLAPPSFGVVLLPDEIDDPVEALMLADRSIWALVESRPRRERRSGLSSPNT